jgi:hypothetical protein
MTNLLQILATKVLRRDNATNRLSERVIDRTIERIWEQVAVRVVDMAPAEARGYVRARAANLLLDALTIEYGARHQAAVYAPAMQTTIDRVLLRARAAHARAAFRRAA